MGSAIKFKKGQVCVVVIPNSSYKKKEIDVVKNLSKKFKTLCYVNVNRPFSSLIKEFKSNKIDENKFLFIDATSEKSNHENCIPVGSPRALTKLSLTIKKTIKTGKFDALLFDSLSALCVYHKMDSLTKFVHDLFSSLKETNVSAVFTLQAGTNKDLLGDVSMFADQVIEVK